MRNFYPQCARRINYAIECDDVQEYRETTVDPKTWRIYESMIHIFSTKNELRGYATFIRLCMERVLSF